MDRRRARDTGFNAELEGLLRDYVGRPSPLYLARAAQRGRRPRALAQARGPQPHRLAQDQQRARPGAARQAHGQGPRSSPRPAPASTASRPRRRARCSAWSASSTWAPRTSAARRPTSQRMELLGATVVPVEAGARTLKEARQRGDPRLGHERRHDALHHRLGGRPGALPGDRARPAARASATRRARSCSSRRDRLPDRVDRLRRRRLQRDRHVRRLRRRPGRRADRRRGGGGGHRDRPPRRAAHRRRAPGRAARRARARCCRTTRARSSRPTRSRPGLDYPGSGPEHAWLRDSRARDYVAVSDADALGAFREVTRLEGIIPALETAHALALRHARARATPTATCSACRAAATRTSPKCSPSSELGPGADRAPRSRGSRQARGADALPDGRLPGHGGLEGDRAGVRRRRGGPRRARRAVLRPAGRRPGDPRGGHRGAEGRARPRPRVLGVCEALAPRVPVVVMCYANIVLGPRGLPGADRARPAPRA